MTFPSPTSRRLAYDRDGTIFLHWADDETVAVQDDGYRVLFNDEDDSTNSADLGGFVGNSGGAWGTNQIGWLIFVFPEPTDLDSLFVESTSTGDSWNQVEVSTDTTNGTDGTWTQIVSSLKPDPGAGSVPGYRDAIVSAPAAGIRGVRLRWSRFTGDVSTIHLYGVPSPSASDERLAFIDVGGTGLEYEAVLDFANVGQGGLQVVTMALRNVSATQTAQNVTVTSEALTGPSTAWHQLSLDQAAWAGSINLGNLAPGQQVTFYLQQDLPAGADLALHAPRLIPEGTFV